jgi:hypothetical protein
MATLDAESVEAKPRKIKKRKTKGFSKRRPIAGVKGGFILSGSGEIETEDATGSTEYDDDSTFGLNGYFLFPVAPNLRVGGSVWLFPQWDTTPKESNRTDDDGDDAKELDINVMAEYALDFGGVAGYVFFEGGYSLLFPPEDDDAQSEPETGTGFNLGGGVGGGFPLSRQLALRVDVKFTSYSITQESDFGDTTIESTLSGNRVTLNAGVAFGL